MPPVSAALFSEWVRRLSSSSAKERCQAAQDLLVCLQTTNPVPELGNVSYQEAIRRQVVLIPGLTCVIRDGDDYSAQCAFQCLAVIGPESARVLPALLERLNRYPVEEYQVIPPKVRDALAIICGGSSELGHKVSALTTSSNDFVRFLAVRSLGLLPNLVSRVYDKQPDGTYLLPLEDRLLQQSFWAQVPVLARCVNDRDGKVRVSALQSLANLTRGSQNAAWESTLPDVVCALRSPNLAERRAASLVLSNLPLSLFSALPALCQSAQDKDRITRRNSKIAFWHEIDLNRFNVLNYFLREINRGGTTAVRAVRNLLAVATVIWPGLYYHYEQVEHDISPQYPVLQWTPRRLSQTRYLSDFERRAIIERENDRLLAGLVAAFNQRNFALDKEIAQLVLIFADGTDGFLYHGAQAVHAQKRVPVLLDALSRALTALENRAPELSQRFREMRSRLQRPHETG